MCCRSKHHSLFSWRIFRPFPVILAISPPPLGVLTWILLLPSCSQSILTFRVILDTAGGFQRHSWHRALSPVSGFPCLLPEAHEKDHLLLWSWTKAVWPRRLIPATWGKPWSDPGAKQCVTETSSVIGLHFYSLVFWSSVVLKVLGSAGMASPGTFLKCRFLGPFNSTKSEILGWGPAAYVLTSPFGDSHVCINLKIAAIVLSVASPVSCFSILPLRILFPFPVILGNAIKFDVNPFIFPLQIEFMFYHWQPNKSWLIYHVCTLLTKLRICPSILSCYLVAPA